MFHKQRMHQVEDILEKNGEDILEKYVVGSTNDVSEL
jgi:hypothetical protein